ncbi:MAG: hypothetical protein JW850_16385 [Thermoflexales bacterium]|nr:hypothetical protein [Thermoflexales bacterium]
MRTSTLLHMVGALAGATLLGLILCLCVPPTARAAPAEGDQGLAPAPRDVSPAGPPADPRWLNIVQASLDTAAKQAALPTLHLHLTDGRVAGRVAMATGVTISLTRDGVRLAYDSVTPLPDDPGYFYSADLGWAWAAGGGGGSGLLAGDVVWVAQAGLVASMTVPALSGLAEAETDSVYGTAPAGQPLTVYVLPFEAPDLSFSHTVTASLAGDYQLDWSPSLDLRPRDGGYVAYTQAPGRHAYVRFCVPFLRVWIHGALIEGMAAPNSSLTLTVTDPSGSVQDGWYVWYSSSDGSFRASWWRYEEMDTGLHPGARVVVSAAGQVFSMTVPTITTSVDLVLGQVRGQAPAGRPVEVIRYTGPLQSDDDDPWENTPAGRVVVTATSGGQFTASLALARADYGAVMATLPDGYQAYTRFAVPYVWIRLGEASSSSRDWIRGQVNEMAVPITLAVQGPSGYLKDLWHFTTAGNGCFSPYGYDYFQHYVILEGGDIVTLATPSGVQVALSLPVLTAQAEAAADSVSGRAPPGAVLKVSVSVYPGPFASLHGLEALGGGYPYGHTLLVTATAQGEYLADFSGWLDFTAHTWGEVELATPDGHTVVRTFQAPLPNVPYVQSAQVGGNVLEVGGYGDCSRASARLLDSHGYIKAEVGPSYVGHSKRLLLQDREGRPVSILPGDAIEIECCPYSSRVMSMPRSLTGATLTMPVPELSVSLDPVANALSGQAPPGGVLWLLINDDSRICPLTTTVSAQGSWSLDLAGWHTLAAGDRVQVTYYLSETIRFYAIDALPRLQVSLYKTQVGGVLPPLTPYTIGLASLPFTKTQVSDYASESGVLYGVLPAMPMPGDTLVVTTPVQTFRLPLPFLSAMVDLPGAQVYGQAPPGARLQVRVWNWEKYDCSKIITATATGLYTTSFSSLPASGVNGTLTYVSDQDHLVNLDFATPHWMIVLDSHYVNGSAGVGGIPITLSLQARDGTLKGIFTGTTWSGGGSFSADFGNNRVQGGDQLVLEHPAGVMTFSVPVLTVHHDYGRQVMEGLAPPFSTLEVTFWGGPIQPIVRHVQADVGGHYGVDTSDLRLRVGQWGKVLLTDERTNTIQLHFTIVGYPVYLPLVVRSG